MPAASRFPVDAPAPGAPPIRSCRACSSTAGLCLRIPRTGTVACRSCRSAGRPCCRARARPTCVRFMATPAVRCAACCASASGTRSTDDAVGGATYAEVVAKSPGSSFLRITRTTVGSRRGLSNLKPAWPIKSSGTEKADPRSAKSPSQASETMEFFCEFRRIALSRILAAAKTEKLRPS
jgi:hypothetical protein